MWELLGTQQCAHDPACRGIRLCFDQQKKVEFVAEKSVLTVSGNIVLSQVTRLMSVLT